MPKRPLVSIIIVTYNSVAIIAECLRNIKQQSYNSYEILLIDNNSRDSTLRKVPRHSVSTLIKNSSNLGFSRAVNHGIALANGEFILLLNPDAYLTQQSLSLLLHRIQSHSRLGFVCPKLLKPQANLQILDSTGIQATRERRFFDRGRNEIDVGQYDQQRAVFAGCGAALLLRKEALADIQVRGEYLDEDFFAYFEDVDLCWRMQLRGWKGAYCPEALVYHSRGHDLVRFDTLPLLSFLQQRYSQRKTTDQFKSIRRYCFYNSIYVLIKNDSFFELLRNFIPLTFYWTKRFSYFLLFEPYIFKHLGSFFRGLFVMLNKRKFIRSRRKIKDKDLRPLFVSTL